MQDWKGEQANGRNSETWITVYNLEIIKQICNNHTSEISITS